MTGTNQNIRIRQAACIVVLTLFVMSVFGCSSMHEEGTTAAKTPTAREKIVFGTGGALPAIVAIAVDQGYFDREGLDVTIKPFLVGKNAIDDVLAGKSDVANSAETPVVIQSFQNDDLLILTSLRSTDNLSRIAARRDRGVRNITSLRGRRVGIASGIAPHYFLDLALAKYGMTEKDIVPVFMKIGDMQSALVSGAVDAIATINLVAYHSIEQLGEKGIILEEPGLCLNYSLLTSTKKFVNANPEKISRLIRALLAAEQFRRQFPDRSRTIVMTGSTMTLQEYDSVWNRYDNRLSLDNSMLLTLEENADWAQKKGFVTRRAIPNYLNLIDAVFLEKVAPGSVRLKR
ncbi:MAG: NrtA/SsuA/CpmA family ABC transporter substrate-binding protein [Desulfuromonadaceae bacterium]|nr:NrtA/SsuA/CpmA family ABC transporter substrate-binding protein [Desulfuromonadaceae bacterium]